MLLPLLCAIAIPAQTQTANQQTLNQYVTALQSNPNDAALRGKIIALARTMRPAPVIPEEARGHYVMAATFMEQAKDNTGFQRAVAEYKAALLIAPWWSATYEKLAIAQKAAGQYDDAIASLNLYLLTQPADARDAQDEIYKLKALKQSAADDQARTQQEEQQRQQAEQQRQRQEQQRAYESSPAGIAAKRQQQQQELLGKLNGSRYYCGKNWTIDIQGNRLKFRAYYNDGVWRNTGDDALDGLEVSWSGYCLSAPGQGHPEAFRAVISSEGNSIDVHGGMGACGSIATYRLNGGGDCDLRCEVGRPVTISGGFYCAN